MALKLDELINKKKEPSQILDLSKVKIRTKEEFEKYFDKIPEFKIRPEKIRPEDARVRDTDFSFTSSKKEARHRAKHEFVYGDPVPVSMRSVRLEDLAAVDISWRMLTMARPKNKLEEDIFNRIVELGKLRLNTVRYEAQLLAANSAGLPASQANLMNLGIVVYKNKRGGTETRLRSCKECGEELCTGKWCKEYPYESYTRMMLDKDELEKQEAEEFGGRRRKNSKVVDAKAKGKAKPAANAKPKIKLKRKKRKKKVKKEKTKTSGSDDE